jgi:hypothetical protein
MSPLFGPLLPTTALSALGNFGVLPSLLVSAGFSFAHYHHRCQDFCSLPVEVGLHTVVLNKVISYLILYNKLNFPGYFTCGLVCGLVYNGHLAGTG